MDKASAHRPDQELISYDGNIWVEILPSNCTALIQPMDQNMIQHVKVTYWKRLLQEVVLQECKNILRCLKNVPLEDAMFALTESRKEMFKNWLKSHGVDYSLLILSSKNLSKGCRYKNE